MAEIAKFISKNIGDLDKSHIVIKSNLSKILGLDIPTGGSCPASVNAGTASVYGPISNLCDVSSMESTPVTYRVCIPASENLYSGPVEYGHDFTVTLKSLTYDYAVNVDMYLRDMLGAAYDVDPTTYINFGGCAVSSGVDLVIPSFEYLMDGSRDIIFEIGITSGNEIPISSNIVSGHSMWKVVWPGPVITEHTDSGYRGLIVQITEV